MPTVLLQQVIGALGTSAEATVEVRTAVAEQGRASATAHAAQGARLGAVEGKVDSINDTLKALAVPFDRLAKILERAEARDAAAADRAATANTDVLAARDAARASAWTVAKQYGVPLLGAIGAGLAARYGWTTPDEAPSPAPAAVHASP